MTQNPGDDPYASGPSGRDAHGSSWQEPTGYETHVPGQASGSQTSGSQAPPPSPHGQHPYPPSYPGSPYDSQHGSPYGPQYGPQYGSQYAAQYGPPYGKPYRGTDGFAIASLVTGLLGLGVVAVVLGIVALHRIRSSQQDGTGLAIAGIVLGGLGIVAFVVLAALLVAAFQAVGSFDPSVYSGFGSGPEVFFG